jgi:hypothetical protein
MSELINNRAIEINIHIMRNFVQMRRFIAHNATIFQKYPLPLYQTLKRQTIFCQGLSGVRRNGR